MNQLNPNIYREVKYYAIALDPVHVGTGGYRLGRVDLSIVRDPGTNLPKIPGSSICGVARTFTAMQTGRYLRKVVDGDMNKKIYSCAGKGGEQGENHCGQPDCPVCVAFGFSKGTSNESFHGMAQFFDAQILFFPVHSMVGPVWVSAPSILNQAGLTEQIPIEIDKILISPSLHPAPSQTLTKLNIGWLMLPIKGDLSNEIIQKIKTELKNYPSDKLSLDEVVSRLVLVSDDLFSRIVNDNLEVRTSVAIDPATGAADDKALFTYEALPRATVVTFDISYNNPQQFQINGAPIPKTIDWVKENVEKGLDLLQYLGVGAMNTRGMGRLKVLN
ncbi:MAG: type III-B CRISPR module RAMP protein Cmr4 [Promethearchaeota archaeon]